MHASPSERDIARETMFVALGLGVLFAFMILLSDGEILITRPLWVDEVWTLLVSSPASPVDVITALAQGADGGSGLVHLGAWALQKVVGFPSPALLRCISLVCVLATLCLVYATLRRRFSNDASIAGVLAVGSNYLVVTHAFEARFYGPWLFCCALAAFAIGRHQAAPSRGSRALLAVASVLLCLVHYYGMITLALMAAGVMASHGKRWREAVPLLEPAAAGLLALLAIVPMAIAVRSSLAVPTWVPDFQPRQLLALAHQFWIARVPLIAAVALVVGIAVSRTGAGSRTLSSVAHHAASDAGIVALMSMALVPLAMAALSMLGQPSMLFRYNIATALAWG
ncbi:MAG: hypothetical protein ACRENU_02745, partial [Gemmatimonadaceae bacterium]